MVGTGKMVRVTRRGRLKLTAKCSGITNGFVFFSAIFLTVFLSLPCFCEESSKSWADWCDEGMAKMSKADYRGAVAPFTKSLEADEENVEAHYRRGFCYMHLREYQKAADDFRTITVKFPAAGGTS